MLPAVASVIPSTWPEVEPGVHLLRWVLGTKPSRSREASVSLFLQRQEWYRQGESQSLQSPKAIDVMDGQSWLWPSALFPRMTACPHTLNGVSVGQSGTRGGGAFSTVAIPARKRPSGQGHHNWATIIRDPGTVPGSRNSY